MSIVAAQSTPEIRMGIFDSLPRPLRMAIAHGRFVYDPTEIANRIAKGRNPETILRGIERYERKAK